MIRGGPGLVDQDRVDLVDDRVGVTALDHVGDRPGHVVAQVVEPELVVRAVGDVAGVLLAPLLRRHVGQDAADGQPQEAVHPAHQLGLVLGQVVVHRDHVHPPAGERVEIGRRGGHQGLTLTGLHLGDVAQVQGGATGHLDVEVPLPQGALGRLPDHRERLGQQVVQALAVGIPRLEPLGLFPQFGVAQPDEVVLQSVHLRGLRLQPLQRAALTGTQHLLDDLDHADFSPRSALPPGCARSS